MGRASARSQRISQLAKERHNGAQGFVANSADSSTSSSSEDESGVSINDALSFSEGHSLPGRAPTTGDSRAQKYRKLKLDKEAAVLMNSSPKIDSFFRLSSSNVSSPQTLAATSPLFTIEEAIVQLNSVPLCPAKSRCCRSWPPRGEPEARMTSESASERRP